MNSIISPALEKYERRADAVHSLLCVGLDARMETLPERFRVDPHPQFTFNRWIIEQTHEFTAAYKPNMAFYEARGAAGMIDLRLTMDYLHQYHPDIFTLCDAKRGDIASTNSGYVSAIFDLLNFDAVTLHPYTGREGLSPFIDRADKASIILCRTSNPGAREFQDLRIDGKPLWQRVAEKVAGEWNERGNCMLVVGATYPDELRQVRGLVGELTLLIPGIGAQGGEIESVVHNGSNSAGRGMVVSVSRGVIQADNPAEAAKHYRDEINRYR